MIKVNIFDGGAGVSVFRAKIFHWRDFDAFLTKPGHPYYKKILFTNPSSWLDGQVCNTRGGHTEIWVYEEESNPNNYLGQAVKKTIADCSTKDVYNKKKGLNMCFGRYTKKYLKKRLLKIEWGINEVTLHVK